MHRATGRDTLRTIRRSLSRYLSIALIIAIGVAFFAGLTSSGSDMRLTADLYYTHTHTQDMQILSTLGFSQADLDAIAAIDGVDQVVGSYFVDCLTISPDNFLTRVLSLPDNPWQGNEGYLNRLALLEGRVPKHDNECVIDQNIRDKYGFRLGDTLTLRSAREGEDLSDTLANTAFTVVGVANSPLYIDMTKRGATTIADGSLDAWIYIPHGNFKTDFYTQLSITYAPAREFACYDEGYLPSLEPLRQALEQIAEDRAQPRMEEMRLYLTDKIADGQQQLADVQIAGIGGDAHSRQQADVARGVDADVVGQLVAAQRVIELDGGDGAQAQIAQHPVIPVVPQDADGIREVRLGGARHGGAQLLPLLPGGVLQQGELQMACRQDLLVLGLPEIQAVAEDEVLHGGVDEVGDVAAQIDVLADAGGADVL